MSCGPLVRWIIAALMCLSTPAMAQAARQPPVTFAEFSGTWVLDAAASQGRIAGVPAPQTIIVAPEPEFIRMGSNPMSLLRFRVDGTQTKSGSDRTERFTLAAGKLIFTTTHQRGVTLTNVITDVFSVVGDVLTVERQISVLSKPLDGDSTAHIVTPASGTMDSLRQTNVYHRELPGPAR